MNSLGRSALIPVALVLVLFLMGKSCSGHPYDVTGTYEAPVGGYQAVVTSKQHEITAEDGNLDTIRTNQVLITATKGDRPAIKIEFLDFGKVRGSVGGAATILDWDTPDRKAVLKQLLTQAGYVNPPANEMEEMTAAIEGVVHGPSGIISDEDQVKAIKVVKVTAN